MGDIREKAADEKFCSSCGEIIKQAAEICPKCGVRQKAAPDQKKNGFVYFTDAMKKYVVFKGRARRAEFWWFALFVFLISFILGLISNLLLGNALLQNIASLAFLLPNLTVGWRRMHDVGKPGGFCFIPIYNIILSVTAGVAGPNQYGPDPKENQ